MSEKRIERTFETGDVAEVSISNVEGSIEIQGWDRPEVEIVAVKQGDDGQTTVEMEADGSRVWARTRAAQGLETLFNFLRRGDEAVTVDYVVRVPHTSSVSAIGVAGPIRVAGIQREVNVHSVNGDITLEDLAGEIAANTVNSSIVGRRVAGELTVDTVSGRVELIDGRLTSLQAQSVDGSIRATGQVDQLRAEAVNGAVHLTSSLHPEGRYTLKTVNGSFHLAVPRDTACEIVAEGLNVGVECELPHTVEEKRWGSWAGRVNDGGGAQVKFDTVNGTLSLTSEEVGEGAPAEAVLREPASVTPEPEPAPQAGARVVETPEVEEPATAPEATAPSKMDILKALEGGELDVEEALERLRTLN